MVEKVTKEERMATLMKEAAEKAIEILGNKDDFMDEDLTGEEVKAKKPKAEKVKDASGGDEQADNRTRDAVGSDGNQLKKMRQIPISPHMLEGKKPNSRFPPQQGDHTKLPRKDNIHNWESLKCDMCGRQAVVKCKSCDTHLCKIHAKTHGLY